MQKKNILNIKYKKEKNENELKTVSLNEKSWDNDHIYTYIYWFKNCKFKFLT